MRILFLPRYSPQGASSRYRIWQYVPLFERAGHVVEVRPLLENGYLAQLYETGRRGWRWLAKGYAKRLVDVFSVRRFDAVICEQEVLPFLPAFVELFVQRLSPRFFVDFDDAAHDKYEGRLVLRRKIPLLMAGAEAVVVGNSYLADYARQFTERVFVIPTVVDLSRYPYREKGAATKSVRIAWIGTPLTAKLLEPLVPVLGRLKKKRPELSFRFIGAGASFASDGLNAELPEWSEQTEAELLAECDIGIMPLPDTKFARGKCGLKLIQYMACGLPVVASPVGVNQEIVEEGKNGFLATTQDEWYEKLDRLIGDTDFRTSLGKAGRAKAAACYSLEHGFSKWQEILGMTDH